MCGGCQPVCEFGLGRSYQTDDLTGAAAQSVSVDGKLKSGEKGTDNDRMGNRQGEVNGDSKSSSSNERKMDDNYDNCNGNEQEEEEEDENIAEGLEAEEGDFVNVEVAFAYRARTTGAKDLVNKSKNAHLYLAFYLPGSIRFRKSLPIYQFSEILFRRPYSLIDTLMARKPLLGYCCRSGPSSMVLALSSQCEMCSFCRGADYLQLCGLSSAAYWARFVCDCN